MQPGGRVALGLGIGYLLGRSRKMKLALALAGLGAAGKLGGSPGGLVGRASSALGSLPVVSQVTEQVRGELFNAVKAAAMTAASSRIDSLSGRIQGVAGKGDADEAEKPTGRAKNERSAEPEAEVPKPRRDGSGQPKTTRTARKSSSDDADTTAGKRRSARTTRTASRARR